jgi:small-conductance mechanosensitive channel
MSDRTQQVIDWFTGAPLRVVSVFLIALISQSVGHRTINRAVAKLASADIKPGPGVVARQAERARTIGTVLTSTLNAFIWVIAFGMILGEFGFDLGPVIASAGIIGVAIGLGAQSLVKDVLSGIFMLVEDQYGVGDQVKVGDVEGSVEKVGLRTTTVRDGSGTLWFLRNGEILVVGNKSKKPR